MIVFSQIIDDSNEPTGFMIQPDFRNTETMIFFFEFIECVRNGNASFKFLKPLLIFKISYEKTKKELEMIIPDQYCRFLEHIVAANSSMILKVSKKPFTLIYEYEK